MTNYAGRLLSWSLSKTNKKLIMNTNGIASNPAFGKIIDDLFNRSISDIVGADFTNESPSVNIIETDQAFELEVAAPGLSKEDFSLSIEKDHLNVSVRSEERIRLQKLLKKI